MPYIICSKSTEEHAKGICSNCEIIVIEGKLKDIKYETLDDLVIGIGGGSVIDYAKIVSGDRSCIAIPTTAAAIPAF